MSSDIALAVVGKIVEKTVDPIVNTVVRQFSYIFCYKQNIQTLGEQLAELEASSAGVQLSTSEAERNLEIVDPTVKLWLTKVDDIKSKAIEVNEGISTVGKGCLNGWCPNLKQRYLLSRKSTKLTAGIRKLKGKGEKDAKFSHSCPIGILSSEGPSISPKDDGFKSFATRIAIIKDVMDALKDEKINLIGISGMGGVGKTTLVKQVLEKVKEENLFNEIAMTAASQQPDLVKIQNEIAGMLGLKLTDESSNARALRLCERLKRGGSVLVVVDDIWEGIDLGEVGIPTGNGCKVVFTTRMERACTEMAAQSHIKVKVLSDQEGWNLFQDAAGDCVKNEDLVDIAKEVAKECGGLPIALVTLGKALSGRENYEWEDTLRQLKKSLGIDKRVQSCISLSYNFIESRLPDAQPLLLLCSLFEEDKNIPIEQLVKYSMGLDLFDEVETFEETRNRVHTLVNYLKSSNLLLQGDQNSDLYVKLHDTVRDVCLLIASDSPHEYLVKHDLKLKHWPRNNRQKAHTAIALNSGVMEELPSGLEYPNLRLLHLQLKHENIKITEDFFEGMGGLQVFNFDGRKDGSTVFVMPKSNVILPPTLKLLTNLQTLSLEFCKLGRDVSSIGCLKGLKILSFFKSQLDEFPREIGELKNLKLLDLRCEECSLNIEVSLLSRLDQLEILYMGKEVFPSIKELNSLSCLTTLQINVSSGTSLLELEKSVFDKLKRFDVSIGFCFGKDSSGQYGIIRNNVSLSEDDLVWLWHAKLHSLVRRIQSFDIRKCDDEQFAFDETDSAFHKLELLEIKKMSNLREIGFDSKTPYGSFHRLQELRIIELPKLEHLWRGPSQPPSFGNLRVIDIDSCESLESLISPDVARCLVQLEKLSIIDCALDGVISNKGEERDKGFRKIQFPKLKSIKLENLSNFKSFCPELDNEGGCGTIQSLFSQLVSFPSLEGIDLRKVPSLERILGHQMQEGSVNNLRSIYLYRSKKLKIFVDSTKLQNLEEVEIRHCESMEVVFDLEGLKVAGKDSPVIFNKLEKIELHILKNLTHVWRMVPEGLQGFRNLTTLDLYDCNKLRYLMSYSLAKMVVNLQFIRLRSCGDIVGVIEGEDDEECSIETKLMEYIVFPCLRVLLLRRLGSLTSFCSSKYSFEFPQLEKVQIESCPEMKFFCGGDVKAPILKEPVEDPKQEQWIWEGHLNKGIYSGISQRISIEDLAFNLANASPAEQRMMLGENLYPIVEHQEPEAAAKVTGMLLEIDQTDVLHLLESPGAVEAKVEEAMEVLRNAQWRPARNSSSIPIGALASALANASPADQRRILGKNLYLLVEKKLEPEVAGKVTGMLLEMDQTVVLHLLESPEALTRKVAEAMEVLRIAKWRDSGMSPPISIERLTYALENASPADQRIILGSNLYLLVEQLEPEAKAKITGMLLELDKTEILHLLESPEALKARVAEAIEVLGNGIP